MLAEVSGVELRVPRDNHARSRVAGIIKNHVLERSRYSWLVSSVDRALHR